MTVALSDFVDSLKREVNPPGVDVFSALSDDDYTGYLADAFWEASLDGFLHAYTCDTNGNVEPVDPSGADITRAEIALIILYAGVRMLRNRILNINTSLRAKAGPVEFEQSNSATMLVEMLKQLADIKARILSQLTLAASLDMVIDAYSTRLYSPISYWGGREIAGGF